MILILDHLDSLSFDRPAKVIAIVKDHGSSVIETASLCCDSVPALKHASRATVSVNDYLF